jgi:hypothetical protein
MSTGGISGSGQMMQQMQQMTDEITRAQTQNTIANAQTNHEIKQITDLGQVLKSAARG